MGLFTPTILGGNSYLSWFYDRGAIKDTAHTGTSKGLSQAINRGAIRKFQRKYANVYFTIQSHGLSAGARTYYVTATGSIHLPQALIPIREGERIEGGNGEKKLVRLDPLRPSTWPWGGWRRVFDRCIV